MSKQLRGMTLLELVVVLAILAVVTGIAVASFTAVEDETRRNASADLIDRVERSTIGANTSEEMSVKDFAPSFLSDTGRLPRITNTDPTPLYLRELWEKPNDLLPYSLVVPVSTDPTVTTDINDMLIGRGWRGPYLRLGVGQDGLFDGYGNPLHIESVPNTHATALFHGWVANVQGFGSDGVGGPSTLPITPAHDIPLTPKVLFDPDAPGSLFPSLSVSVSKKDGNPIVGTVRVHLIYPDTTNSNGYTVSSATLSDTTTLSHIFTSVPVGPRVIRVVYNGKKSTFHFVIPRGGISTGLPLELP